MSEAYNELNNQNSLVKDHFDVGSPANSDIDGALDIYLEELYDYDFTTAKKSMLNEYFDTEVGSAYQHFLVSGAFFSDGEKTNSIGQLTDRVVEATQLWAALSKDLTLEQINNFPKNPIILYTQIIDEAGDIYIGATELYEAAKKINI